ncbi:MAG: hypothetical protein ACPGSD_17640 [Flavobacteriales bacterium]|jgi:Na+-driven multidrug efflux pump
MKKTIDFIEFLYEEEIKHINPILMIIGLLSMVYFTFYSAYCYLLDFKDMPTYLEPFITAISMFTALSWIIFYWVFRIMRKAFRRQKKEQDQLAR